MNTDSDKRFFRRHDWAAFWTGTVVSFLVYFFTCAPSVTLEDCGELAVAGDYMGVPHPPGYPSWTVCAWLFARLLSWVTFRGQPNPAWAIAVMSAFWGALATGLAAMLVSRSAADLLSWRRRRDAADDPDADRFVPVASGVAGAASALVFAFSPVMWSQSTIVEVYSFNAFFLMLVLLLAYRWMRRPSARLLVLTAFLFGLGLTNYQVLLLALVPLVLVILLQDVALFRDLALLGVPAGALVLLMSLGSKSPLPGFEKHVPLSPTGLVGVRTPSSSPLLANNPGEELPVGGTPNAFQGEWVKVRTPFGLPSAWVDPKTGEPRGDYATDARGNPRLVRGRDGLPHPVPLYCFTYYPETTDAESLIEALRRDVKADAERLGTTLDEAALDAEMRRRAAAGRLDTPDSIRERLSTPENGRYARAQRNTRLTAAAAALLALLFAGAAAVLGRRARRGAAGPSHVPGPPPVPGTPPVAALVVLGLAGLGLAVVCLAILPAAPPLPADGVSPDLPRFGWFDGPLVPALLFPALVAALWILALFTRGGLWYAAGATGLLLPLAVFVRKGALLGLTHPLNPCFAVWCGAGAALLALAWLLLENGRVAVLSFLAGALGVAGYLLMPLLGDSCPPMNWGYPRTWEGFKHALTRGQYEEIKPSSMFSAQFIHNIGFYFKDVRAQFTMLLAPFALVPFAALRLRPGRSERPVDLLGPASVLAAAVGALAVLDRLLPSVDFQSVRLPPDKALFALVGLVALAGVHAVFAREFLPLARRVFDRSETPSRRLVSGLAWAGFVVVAAALALGFLNAFAEYVLEVVFDVPDPGDLLPEGHRDYLTRLKDVLAYRWRDYGLTAVLFVAWAAASGWLGFDYFRRRADVRADDAEPSAEPPPIEPPPIEPPPIPIEPPALDPAMGARSARWLVATVVCFFVMSFVLIALANPKGDIQDNFIQKVKFISSHGLYSLWIGYGLALALWWGRGFVRRVAPGRASALVALAVAAVLATPLLPVNENYNNFRLVNETSAADQDGHDFGWQFGNYQLRGAPAITEELSEDEEPLPDPTYPRPMGPDAVFFGGTDPGRFVPTYMIYSAMVRPDVYLITQNALADSTYLDTMRGISREGEGVQGVYSDQIWMPTVEDNRRAFQRYTDDVQSGRRPDIGGITRTPDGRVSVNGALAVMQINAIIAEDIFLKNRDRHDFYVEESYPMDWMYRYITPNGLIMKVNRDEFWKEGARPVPYPAAVANADMDFWDWYVRRLVNDPKYGRDMPARKAFNKLRSALAGTYVQRGDRVRAERAYNQAHALYVMSPETLRGLVLNIDLAANRTALPLRRIDELLALDPNNGGVRAMSNEVARITGAMDDLRVLGPIVGYAPERATPDQRLRLARAALVLGHAEVAERAVLDAEGRAALPPADLFDAGLLFADSGQAARASRLFALVPNALLADAATDLDDLLKAYEAHIAAKDYASAMRTLAAYLPRRRNDWEKWLEYAVLCGPERQTLAAQAVRNALAAGGDKARRELRRYPQLSGFAAEAAGPAPLLPSAR